ncbi:Calcium uniporter protein, mitochondrial [Clonorchis sinensis]|uniref:Calcium uniporter protein n=2 Tax=Clonorchis sinensis TaxID=79923 RepID=H2KP42_CLOSI|nr:Calcium uniporter protein, mitochondrial [Clonorchis sinensis]GAA29012.2 coiled-coil domain-containing protein 109A [Clonorchis sinensis]
MTLRGVIHRLPVSKAITGSIPTQCRSKQLSTETDVLNPVRVTVENGLPQFCIPLPSRRDTCMFIVKPLQHTVGDLTNFIMSEDRGVDYVAFINKNGTRIAKSNTIADLLTSNFQLVINKDVFHVDTTPLGTESGASSCDLSNTRLMVSRLANALHSDEFHKQQELELERRIEDVSYQLQPFEELKTMISKEAAKRTRRLTWLGLGAMGLQFGLLARLTWWEYSWDIMEPVTYFVGYGTSMAMYAYYVLTRQDYSFPQVFDREYLKRFYKCADKHAFDVNRYNELREQLADLKSELRRLRDPLLCNLPLQQTAYLVAEQAIEAVNRGPAQHSVPRNPTTGTNEKP